MPSKLAVTVIQVSQSSIETYWRWDGESL